MKIKYKGKRIDNGDWVYGYAVCSGEAGRPNSVWYICVNRYECPSIFPQDNADDAFIWYRVDPKTVSQFTGVIDKQGVEIYQNDLLEGTIVSAWSKYKIVCRVIWCKDSSWSSAEAPNQYGDIYGHKLMFGKDCVVIGNIFDNPELYVHNR